MEKQSLSKALKIVLWISSLLSAALIIAANLLLHDAPDYYTFIVWVSLPLIILGSILLMRLKLVGVWLYTFGIIPTTTVFIYQIIKAIITPCDPASIWPCRSFIESVFASPVFWGFLFLVPTFFIICSIYLWHQLRR